MNKPNNSGPPDLETIKSRIHRPKKAVVTAGMPYANGPLHLGHLAGAQLPADFHARFMKMLIGDENVLYVCGTDDHGSTTELGALKAGVSTSEHLKNIHDTQEATIKKFNVCMDVYSGTSAEDCFPVHKDICQSFMTNMNKNGLLTKKTSRQWYDPKLNRFLQDRFVTGECPNPHCENKKAYSDECDVCGSKYDSADLVSPNSALSDATPELKDTDHLWLNMWEGSEILREWILTKRSKWRKPVYSEVINTVLPSFEFDRPHEEAYKEFRSELPKHKSRYAPGKKQVLQFSSKPEMAEAETLFASKDIKTKQVDGWAHRSITRDVSWGIPIPEAIDPDMGDKTLYVWPESLIAPISFTKVALKKMGKDPETYKDFWKSEDSKIYQFLGQDNVYFYVLMQGAMWLANQEDPTQAPKDGEFQFSEVFGCQHLMVDGDKMSKSKLNFYTGDQLIDEKGYHWQS